MKAETGRKAAAEAATSNVERRTSNVELNAPDFSAFNWQGYYTRDEQESLLARCEESIRNENRADTSLIQRRFRLGFVSASQILDVLEYRGVVGPFKNGKPRKVLPTFDVRCSTFDVRCLPQTQKETP